MAVAIFRGRSDPIFQKWEIEFSPRNGGTTKFWYQGIDPNQMGALAQVAVEAGYSGTLSYQNSVATMTVQASNTATVPGFTSPARDIVDKWEIAVDQEKPDLFENSNFLGLFTGLDAAYGVPISQQVAHVIRQVAGGDGPTWPNLVTVLNGTPASDASGNPIMAGAATVFLGAIIGAFSLFQAVKYFADDFLRGRTSFLNGKNLLRHTTSAPNTYSANVADFNVQKIYSISQLLTETQNGALWILPLPGYLAYKILTYPVPFPMPPNYVWGALKMRSGATTVARDRVEIVTEYLIDACPKHTYGLIS